MHSLQNKTNGIEYKYVNNLFDTNDKRKIGIEKTGKRIGPIERASKQAKEATYLPSKTQI